MVSLMSGILSLARELYLMYLPPNQAEQIQKSLFWRCVFISFILSAALAWWVEHKALVDEKAKNLKPDIRVRMIAGFLAAWTDVQYNKQRTKHTLAQLKRIIFHVALENHRPVATTCEEIKLELKLGNAYYKTNATLQTGGRFLRELDSGTEYQMCDLDVDHYESLEYAHHDEGWLVFDVPNLDDSHTDAVVTLWVIDGLRGVHVFGPEPMRLKRARVD
jgi:hypothetical protein